ATARGTTWGAGTWSGGGQAVGRGGRAVAARSGGREEFLHLRDGRVRQGGTVREHDRGYGPVAAVDAGDVLGCLRVLFDVDDLVGDTLAVHLGGEPAAVSAPGGRVHRQHGGRHLQRGKGGRAVT